MDTFNYPCNDFINITRNKNGMNPYYQSIGFIPETYNESHDSNEHTKELILPVCR